MVLDDKEDEDNEFDNFVLLDDNTGGKTITDLIKEHPICAKFHVDDGLDSHKKVRNNQIPSFGLQSTNVCV